MRLIDADALLNKINEDFHAPKIDCLIYATPTIDAIVLPCKPGSTVYEIERYPNDDFCKDCPDYCPPFPGDPASCLKDDGYWRCVDCMTISETVATINQILHWIELNLVGEFVFLTREEAEAALAERKKKDA